MDGGKTRGRIYRQKITEVLKDCWELTPDQRSSIPFRITSFAGVDIIWQFVSGTPRSKVEDYVVKNVKNVNWSI